MICTMDIKLVVVVVATRCVTLAYELEGDSNND